jgi:formate hydrogenlyase subunit 4
MDRGRGAGADVGPVVTGLGTISLVLLGCVLLAVHVVLMVAMAPIVRGIVTAGVARLGGERSAPVLMRWRWIRALARRRGLRATGTVEFMPALALAAALAGCALVPSFALGLPVAGLSDLLVVAALLGLVRLALLVPALAPGGARAGRAAAGSVALLAVMQAVFPLVVAGVVLATGHGGIDGILVRMHDPDMEGSRTPLILAAVALLLAGADVGPGDEAQAADMLVELGGRDRAALELARDLALLAWITLAGDLAWPGGLVPLEGGDAPPLSVVLSLPGAMAAWLLRIGGVCVGIVAARVVVLAPGQGRRVRLLLAVLFGMLAVVVLFAGREFG